VDILYSFCQENIGRDGDRYLLLFGHRLTPMNTDYETFYGDGSMFAAGWIPFLRRNLGDVVDINRQNCRLNLKGIFREGLRE
jgi:hypothetical protein